MGDDRVAPVEEPVVTVADEDVGVVQVVVLERGRDAEIPQAGTRRRKAALISDDPAQHPGGHPVGVPEQEGLVVGEQAVDQTGQPVDPRVGHTRSTISSARGASSTCNRA
jgi:hypothetical protein